MKIEFASARLSLLKTNDAYKLGLPISVISGARKKIVLLESAPDERTLRNWKSLNYKKLNGEREGQMSIRINDQYRIIFTLNDECQPPSIVIIDISDIHK